MLVLFPLILIGIMFFIFWLIMLIDSAKRKFKNDTDKIVWILVNILVGVLGALIYYFVVYIKDEEKSMKWFWITILVLFVLSVFLIVLGFFASDILQISPI